jgi:hypothetical protein
VHRLNEKIKQEGKFSHSITRLELKINIFHLFAQFGEVIEIGVNPAFKMRG